MIRHAPRALILLLPFLLGLLGGCGQTDRAQGQNLYEKHCANCHMSDGTGLGQLNPPLAGADYLRENPARVVKGIRYGMQGPMVVNGVQYDEAMPGNAELSEFQIVNIVNYINKSWGNDYDLITVPQAREWLSQ